MRIRTRRGIVLILPVLAACLVLRSGPASLHAQATTVPPPFRFERPLSLTGDGPHRLPIDVPLLSGGAPFRVERRPVAAAAGADEPPAYAIDGLRDLRLYDASGGEVPYLLVAAPAPDPRWRPVTQALAIPAVETDIVRTSGLEADLGGLVTIDRVRVSDVPAPFMKRARVEGSGDRVRWTVLVNEGTLFDLPDASLRQLELGFAPGAYRYLRVTWDDRQSARLAVMPGVFVREVANAATAGPPLTAPVTFQRVAGEPHQSHFRIALPAARLPIVALHLDIAGTRVFRDADVYETRLTGVEAQPVAIGQAALKRVEQGTLAAAALRVPVQPPAEAELDLVVEDGDNPPLDLRGVTIEFAELPWVYVEGAAGTLTARYGNDTLAAPRYDLEAARASLAIGQVPEATWGDARRRSDGENTAATPAPPLPTLGAAIDGAAFRYARTLPPGDAGLVAVRLDAAVLAHSAGPLQRFADVRVLTADGRQVPYLVERVTQPLTLELRLDPLAARPESLGRARAGESVYRLALPFSNLPSPRVVLSTSARVFRRDVRLVAERQPDRQHRDPWVDELVRQTWAHANEDRAAADIALPLPTTADASVLLIVEDGDNTPLPIAQARLLLPEYRLRLFREGGQPLTLIYGRSDIGAPNYDLGLLASRVLGAPAIDITMNGEQDVHPHSDAQPTAFPFPPRLFWGILAVAVVILLGLIGRLLRKPGA